MYNIFSGPQANSKKKTQISQQISTIQSVYVKRYDTKNKMTAN